MIQYIYFVKCPNCEDEPFDFFKDAKDYALSCLSSKPIITQVEVDRNDFGECTDSSDLGTIWSWEDMMKETDAEPATSIFTKDDFAEYDPDNDPEFTELDNSVEATPDNFKKPVPANMSIKDLVEAMEENEDEVECASCEELYPKEDCEYNEKHGWICPDCEDRVVECTWCEELYDRSECRKEVDLGWLCPSCIAAIKSRGEKLTFEEVSYWDFLDEDVTLTEGKYDFPYLALGDNKLTVEQLNEVKSKILTRLTDEGYIKDGTFSFSFKSSYYDSIRAKDFMFVDGELEIIVERTFNDAYTHKTSVTTDNWDLKFACSKAKEFKSLLAQKILRALTDIAGELNSQYKPKTDRVANRNRLVTSMLTDELANYFKDHIVDIKFRIPLSEYDMSDIQAIDPEATDELATAAADRVNKIRSDFFDLPFADAAEKADMVEDREPSERAAWILSSWGPVGKIKFNCRISDFEGEDIADRAREIIYKSKVMGEKRVASFDQNTTETDCYRLAVLLIKHFNNDVLFFKKSLTEAKSTRDSVDFEYEDLTAVDNDDNEYTMEYTYYVDKDDVATDLWEREIITDEDIKDVPGGFETLEDETEWQKFLTTHFDDLVEKYYDRLLDLYRKNAEEELQDKIDEGDISVVDDYEGILADIAYDEYRDRQLFGEELSATIEELEDAKTYRKRLTLCPECGNESFDKDTRICIKCGFN
jgi:hypothetical protein